MVLNALRDKRLRSSPEYIRRSGLVDMFGDFDYLLGQRYHAPFPVDSNLDKIGLTERM